MTPIDTILLIWIVILSIKVSRLSKATRKGDTPSSSLATPRTRNTQAAQIKNDGCEHMSAREYRIMMGLPVQNDTK